MAQDTKLWKEGGRKARACCKSSSYKITNSILRFWKKYLYIEYTPKNPQNATEKICKINKRHDQTFAKENKWMSNKHVQEQLMKLIPRKCKTI